MPVLQYQAQASPVLVPAAFVAATFAGLWTSAPPAPRPALRLVPSVACARPEQPALPVVALSWGPEFADLAPGQRPLPDWQTRALAPFPLPVTVDALGWRGMAPDWLPAPCPAAPMAFSTGMQAPVLPLPAPLVWLGRYVDLAPGARPPADFQAAALSPLPITQTTDTFGWRGRFPDRHVYPRPADFPACATGSTASSLPVPSPLAWAGRWPDRTISARLTADYPATAMPVLPPSATYAVATTCPVPVAGQSLLYKSMTAPVLPLSTTDQLGWRGSFPDRPARQRRTDPPAFASGSTASSLPLVALSWRGVYADRVRAADPWRLYADSVLPATPVLVPALPGWQPTLAGQAMALARPPAQDLALACPQVTVPLLGAWRASYPVRLSVAVRVPDSASTDRVNTTANVPAFWQPRYPDRLPPLVRLTPEQYAIPDWEMLRPVAPSRAWAGTWPDFARGPRPLPVGAYPSQAGFRPLFIPGPSALQFTLQLAVQPATVEEFAAQPATTTERAGQPTFSTEKAVIT